MDVVLGVSMTPTAVRMALVEGERADGSTLDQSSLNVPAGVSAATSDVPEQVVAAILGTRESAAEGGHRLVVTGLAWTDHGSAARVRQALRAARVDNVVLVSELHAASALARAMGQAADWDRTALLLLERDAATLAVVRTADGAVVRVIKRALHPGSTAVDMVSGLESGAEPPRALFVVGSGVGTAALKSQLAARTSLPVHAPADGAVALARGAALAAVNIPRYDATTAGLLPPDDTAAGPTQMAVPAHLGYSAVDDEPDDVLDDDEGNAVPDADRSRFLLLSGALSTFLVLGVVALIISMAAAIRPTADQMPLPRTNGPAAAPSQTQSANGLEAPETIQAPVPVVQEVPRTVFVAPREMVPAVPAAPAPAPAAPLPAAPVALPEPAPAATPAPISVPSAAAVPAPVIPPIVLPIVPPRLPAIFQIPARTAPAPATPVSPSNSTPVQTAPVQTTPLQTTAVQTPVTQAPQTSTSAESTSAATPAPNAATVASPSASTAPSAADGSAGAVVTSQTVVPTPPGN